MGSEATWYGGGVKTIEESSKNSRKIIEPKSFFDWLKSPLDI